MAINKDTIKGKATEIKGKVREQVGKMTNDAGQVAKGNAEQAAGKTQKAYGDLKEDAKEKFIDTVDSVKKSFSSDKEPAREIPSQDRPVPGVLDDKM